LPNWTKPWAVGLVWSWAARAGGSAQFCAAAAGGPRKTTAKTSVTPALVRSREMLLIVVAAWVNPVAPRTRGYLSEDGRRKLGDGGSERFSNFRGVFSSAKSGLFLREKPLDSFAFPLHQLENRSSRRIGSRARRVARAGGAGRRGRCRGGHQTPRCGCRRGCRCGRRSGSR